MKLVQFSLAQRIGPGITAAGSTSAPSIQRQSIPSVLKGRDVLGLAQTGYPVPKKLHKGLLLATLGQEATGRVLGFTRMKYRARNQPQGTRSTDQRDQVRSCILTNVGRGPCPAWLAPSRATALRGVRVRQRSGVACSLRKARQCLHLPLRMTSRQAVSCNQ